MDGATLIILTVFGPPLAIIGLIVYVANFFSGAKRWIILSLSPILAFILFFIIFILSGIPMDGFGGFAAVIIFNIIGATFLAFYYGILGLYALILRINKNKKIR